MRLILYILMSFSLCTMSAQTQLRMVSYNCENLFDCHHDTLKDDHEFLPEGDRHWTFGRYWKKLNDIGRVIHECGGAGEKYHLPDLVALVEVENDSTLFMLTRRSMLREAGYRYVITNSPDVRGVDVALLYNPLTFRCLSNSSIRINPQKGQRPTRDVLYVKGRFRTDDTLHVFVVHAPSRGGGQKQTEPYRMAVAERLCQAVDSICTIEPDARIIIAGDFNDYSRDKALRYISSHGMREAHHVSANKNVMGTYKYQGQWNSLDHVFLSPYLYNKMGSCNILTSPWILEEDAQGGVKPFRTFVGPIYHGGVSDHLPVIVTMEL